MIFILTILEQVFINLLKNKKIKNNIAKRGQVRSYFIAETRRSRQTHNYYPSFKNFLNDLQIITLVTSVDNQHVHFNEMVVNEMLKFNLRDTGTTPINGFFTFKF